LCPLSEASTGDIAGGDGSANQVAQQKEKAQQTRIWWRRMARAERTWWAAYSSNGPGAGGHGLAFVIPWLPPLGSPRTYASTSRAALIQRTTATKGTATEHQAGPATGDAPTPATPAHSPALPTPGRRVRGNLGTPPWPGIASRYASEKSFPSRPGERMCGVGRVPAVCSSPMRRTAGPPPG
jgi:hypothetical protein